MFYAKSYIAKLNSLVGLTSRFLLFLGHHDLFSGIAFICGIFFKLLLGFMK